MSPHITRYIRQKLSGFLFFSWIFFHIWRGLLCLLSMQLKNPRIDIFWVMGQWNNYSIYKYHFRKSLKRNMIRSNTYENINIFWDVDQKIIFPSMFYLISFFIFPIKKKIEIMKQIFGWNYIQTLFPFMVIFYHWLLCISVQTYFYVRQTILHVPSVYRPSIRLAYQPHVVLLLGELEGDLIVGSLLQE